MSIKPDSLPNRLALDVNATQDLRNKFKQDPKGGLKEAAKQFESMFLQMVLKSMRDTVPQDGMMNSDQTRFYTSMLDSQMAQNLANKGGLGFARLMEQQLGRQMSAQGAANSAATPSSVSAETSGAAAKAMSAPKNFSGAGASAMPGMAMLQLQQAMARQAGASSPLEARLARVEDQLARPAVGGLGATASSAPPTSPKEFAERVWPHAVEASRTTGIPPQFLVAHAALESGWGKSEIRNADGTTTHNLFGIKAQGSWSGGSSEANTVEYINGKAQRVTEKFRSYASYADAFRDYANTLRNNPRYGSVIGSQDGTEFARRLQQAGYATDPAYADKLARIINGPTLRQALIG